MRERDGAVNVHAVAAAAAPHGAGKIAQAIGGEKGSALEGGNKKTAREMGLMMLDAMKFSFYFLRASVEGSGECLGNVSKSSKKLGALTGEGRHAQGIEYFSEQARVGITWNTDVIDVR